MRRFLITLFVAIVVVLGSAYTALVLYPAQIIVWLIESRTDLDAKFDNLKVHVRGLTLDISADKVNLGETGQPSLLRLEKPQVIVSLLPLHVQKIQSMQAFVQAPEKKDKEKSGDDIPRKVAAAFAVLPFVDVIDIRYIRTSLAPQFSLNFYKRTPEDSLYLAIAHPQGKLRAQIDWDNAHNGLVLTSQEGYIQSPDIRLGLKQGKVIFNLKAQTVTGDLGASIQAAQFLRTPLTVHAHLQHTGAAPKVALELLTSNTKQIAEIILQGRKASLSGPFDISIRTEWLTIGETFPSVSALRRLIAVPISDARGQISLRGEATWPMPSGTIKPMTVGLQGVDLTVDGVRLRNLSAQLPLDKILNRTPNRQNLSLAEVNFKGTSLTNVKVDAGLFKDDMALHRASGTLFSGVVDVEPANADNLYIMRGNPFRATFKGLSAQQILNHYKVSAIQIDGTVSGEASFQVEKGDPVLLAAQVTGTPRSINMKNALTNAIVKLTLQDLKPQQIRMSMQRRHGAQYDGTLTLAARDGKGKPIDITVTAAGPVDDLPERLGFALAERLTQNMVRQQTQNIIKKPAEVVEKVITEALPLPKEAKDLVKRLLPF